MQENSVLCKTVGELRDFRFVIPDYQRGYRWTRQEVNDLLDDISSFDIGSQKEPLFYYLQPLVVRRVDEITFEVVDGQQRLTTIFIIFKFAADEMKSAKCPYSLEYTTHEGSKTYLDNLKISDEIDKENMEYLVSHTHNEITQHLRDCITKESPSYSDRIIFSAIGVFLGKSKNNIDDKKLGDWFRVISNLTINTTIERPMIYISARNTLDSLGDNCLDILEYMASKNQLTLTGFSPDQINEECVKANLILMGYADIITNAEKHPYFSGQIRSGLNMAELTLDEISSYSDSDIKNRIEKFSEIWSRIADLFGKTQPKNGSLLRASLLSFGDYMPSSGQYLSFCVDRPDEPTSLKALFTSGHKSVIALIDKLLCIQHDTVNQEMQKIVDDKMKTLQNTDWRYWVLKYSDRMFGYLSDSYMRICSLNGTYLLVSKYASSSHCRELFTFALWLELKGANKNASLPREYGRDADYRVVFENKVIRYLNGHFKIIDSSGTIIQTMDIPATINAL